MADLLCPISMFVPHWYWKYFHHEREVFLSSVASWEVVSLHGGGGRWLHPAVSTVGGIVLSLVAIHIRSFFVAHWLETKFVQPSCCCAHYDGGRFDSSSLLFIQSQNDTVVMFAAPFLWVFRRTHMEASGQIPSSLNRQTSRTSLGLSQKRGHLSCQALYIHNGLYVHSFLPNSTVSRVSLLKFSSTPASFLLKLWEMHGCALWSFAPVFHFFCAKQQLHSVFWRHSLMSMPLTGVIWDAVLFPAAVWVGAQMYICTLTWEKHSPQEH